MKFTLLLAAFLLAPVATAQSVEDGCVQSSPCPWSFDVGPDGIDDGTTEPAWNFTAGDWLVLDVFNFDDVAHTLTVADHSWTVPAVDGIQSAPFQFSEPGSYDLLDAPTGHAAPVEVFADDVADDGLIPNVGIPGPSVAPLALGLVLLARRR